MLLLYWLYIFLVANAFFFAILAFFIQSVLYNLLLLLSQEYLMEDYVPCSKLWLVRITEDGEPD